jgi:hypothetical protein
MATATSAVTQHLLEAGLLHGHLAHLARLLHLILQVENQAQVGTKILKPSLTEGKSRKFSAEIDFLKSTLNLKWFKGSEHFQQITYKPINKLNCIQCFNALGKSSSLKFI